ncbi:4362_t:CDS:1, partial [Ambispora leptoticha]
DSNTGKAKTTTRRVRNVKTPAHNNNNKGTGTESDELLDKIANKGDAKDTLSKDDAEKPTTKRSRKAVKPSKTPTDNNSNSTEIKPSVHGDADDKKHEVKPPRRGQRNAASKSNK